MKLWPINLFAVAILSGCSITHPTAHSRAQTRATPLSYDAVVKYFDETGMRKTEVQPRCTIFSEGEWASANHYDYCLIVLENSDEDIQVTFYLTDAHEMNWVTEFLDSPFFTRAETEKLFGILRGTGGVRGASAGRYRVSFDHLEPRHAQIFVLSFTPAGAPSR
jgi:hypothetical protein